MNMDYSLDMINSMRNVKRILYKMNPRLRKKAYETLGCYIQALWEIRRGLPYGKFFEELYQKPEFRRQVICNMEAALNSLRATIEMDFKIREQIRSLHLMKRNQFQRCIWCLI